MKHISLCLWFDTQAEDAVNFYTSVFRNASKGIVTRYGSGMPMPKGTVMTVTFRIGDLDLMALNGGPNFKFNHAISLVLNCETQDEIDDLWVKLAADGGATEQCGWLRDKYGVSWQVVPAALEDMMKNADDATSDRIMGAIMQMTKLDVAALKRAEAGP